MDPVRNPYAPGAGQRPPELAGRDREIAEFEVVLQRVARGRPERSMVLTGLRGVGKTVLLNAFRSMAMQHLWGTGKIEARPEQSIRRPVAGALHMAVRELAPRHRAPDRIDQFLGVLKAFGARDPGAPKGAYGAGLGIDVPAARGRADSGDLEIDLTELLDRRCVRSGRPGRRNRAVRRRDAGRPGARCLRALRGLSRALPERRPADRGRGRPAAPPVGPVGEQELFRTTVQVRGDRPPRPGRRGFRAAGPGPAGRAPTSSPPRWTRCTRRLTATPISSRPTAR